MSMLIKGIDFPTKENFMTQLYLICDKDGDWYAVDTTNKALYKLIEVKEPHGRLIDADEPMTKISAMMQEPDYQHEGEGWMVGLIMARDAIDEAPTVIEAEGET